MQILVYLSQISQVLDYKISITLLYVILLELSSNRNKITKNFFMNYINAKNNCQ